MRLTTYSNLGAIYAKSLLLKWQYNLRNQLSLLPRKFKAVVLKHISVLSRKPLLIEENG